MFQWDDKIRSYSEGAAATSSGHVDRPRSASLASIRLPSRKAALPLAPDEMALWEQQLVVLKQRLRRRRSALQKLSGAKQLIAQLRAARQKAEALSSLSRSLLMTPPLMTSTSFGACFR